MSDLITGITTSLDIVKKLRELNKKVGEAEFKMLLADLTSELGDAKLAAANLKIDLAELKSENTRLKQAAVREIAESPEIDQEAYVFGDKTRHYCTGCYDSSGRKSLLTEQKPPFNVFGKWLCPVCKQHIGGGKH